MSYSRIQRPATHIKVSCLYVLIVAISLVTGTVCSLQNIPCSLPICGTYFIKSKKKLCVTLFCVNIVYVEKYVEKKGFPFISNSGCGTEGDTYGL